MCSPPGTGVGGARPKSEPKEVPVASVQESVDVDVPIRVAYDQWTQFESFPQFMGGVERITQLDDTHTHWVTNVDGVKREFDAEITEQHPEERVAWTSTGGEAKHAGVVTFHKLDDATTRRDDPDRLGARGAGREGRRGAGLRRPAGQGRRREVQGVHREPRRPDRLLARRRPPGLSEDDDGAVPREGTAPSFVLEGVTRRPGPAAPCRRSAPARPGRRWSRSPRPPAWRPAS